MVITGAQTATPTISGFAQTEQIQECEFQLLVNDGQQASSPDTIKVVMVPDFGPSMLKLENPPFDANKPTVIYFWGAQDCINGEAGHLWDAGPAWLNGANVIDFPYGYTPDGGTAKRTYYKYGDMIIAYLSAVAPDYRQAIQTIGFSTGVDVALDVGIRLNETYRDARYAVNRVTEIDGGCRIAEGGSSYPLPEAANRLSQGNLEGWNKMEGWRMYLENVERFLASSVDGEQCWIDFYYGTRSYVGEPMPPSDILWVRSGLDHPRVNDWYRNSLTRSDMNQFNSGVVGGAYWSVIGPGKNLQLAFEPGVYYFLWDGDVQNGAMDFYSPSQYPGRLPEPVALASWAHVSDVSGEIDGVVLSCHRSENAVSYQLLLGSDAYRVAHYEIISETPTPPAYTMTNLPSQETWWTIRARDQYGSTIYADPVRLDLTGLQLPKVQNARTGKRYGLIYQALLDAEPNDRVLLEPGTYLENVEFGDKPLTLASLDPNDPMVTAGTVLQGRTSAPAVIYSGPESAPCTLDGLTIQSETVAISCRYAALTIRNCVVDCPNAVAIEYWQDQEPSLIDCTVFGEVKEGGDPSLIAHWKLDEAEGSTAHDSVGGNDATVVGAPLWQPEGGKVGGALQLSGTMNFATAKSVRNPSQGPLSVFAWVKGGAPGQVILSQQAGANWLMASVPDGVLKTDLRSTDRLAKSLTSATVITDGAWHRVGLVWDGVSRILYVDGIEVVKDTQAGLVSATGSLYLGAGSALVPGTFWSGLIDDVRIYNRAVQP